MTMNLFEFFELKRKLRFLCRFEAFLEAHCRATERKKYEIYGQKTNFLAS